MFELSAVLTGHAADVRSCCMDSQGHIITGSRDRTAIVWEQVDTDPETPASHRWKIKCKLNGHTNFVNAVSVLPCSDEFPIGLIVTAGQDSRILVHCIGIPEPVTELKGHTDGVLCLCSGIFGTILSGSADMSIRVWVEMKCTQELKGHTGPIWDVAIYPGNGQYLSASGDKTIKFWENGKLSKTFSGHTDAVRKLLVLLDGTFVSCSNDYTVRHWDINGSCLHSFSFGSSFLYSISLVREHCYAVTGENGNLYIVEQGQIKQGIQIPALSAWCSSPLPGGDILVGGSDGVARIFSEDSIKSAPLSDREHMKQQVAAQQHSKKTLGDLEVDKLQGVEGLNRPGSEGQTLMIKNNGAVELHKFSGGSWTKIGVVQDAYDKDKHELDGQRYDFVIDVDVDDNRPALKLGCNKGDDPWLVAHQFITKHELPLAYLQQIADYITQNTGIKDQPMELSSEYCDPFTGAGRYVPPSVATPSNTTLGEPRFYPVRNPSHEPVPDASKLIKKIRELNSEVNENCRLDTSEINQIDKITSKTSAAKEILSADELNLVYKLLNWDQERLFPCLDLIRSINKSFPGLIPLNTLVETGVKHCRSTVVSCARVSLRLIVDLTCQHTQQCLDSYHTVLQPLMDCINTTDKKYVSTCLTKILHNMTCKHSDIDKSKVILQDVTHLLEYVIRELPNEEKDRKQITWLLLIATGNLITAHKELSAGVNKHLLKSLTSASFDKTKITASDILRQIAQSNPF